MEKEIEIGSKLYDSFCSNYGDIKVMTPHTQVLIKLALLNKQGHYDLFVREAMLEFVKNFGEERIVVEDGELYKVIESLERI